MSKGSYHVHDNVQESHQDSILASTLDKVTVHVNVGTHGTTLTQIQNLRIKDRRQPISGQDGEIKDDLEAMEPTSGWMIQGIVVKQ
jgi:hypothetical protein